MGGQRAHDAEVFGSLDESLPKEFLPHAIDGHAGGEGVLFADQPAREAEAVLGRVGGEFAQGGGNFGGDLFALLVVLAAEEDVRRRHHVLALFLDVRERAAVLDGLEFRLELLLAGGGDLDVRAADPDVVLQELLLGLRGRLAGKQRPQVVELGEHVGFGARDRAVIEPELLGGPGEEFAGAALAEAGRCLGLAGSRQGVDLELQRRHHAIDIESDAFGLAAAIVGDEDVLPGVLLGERLGGRDLDGVIGPLADQVKAVVGVGEEERPALRGLRIVHPGDEGLRAHHGGRAEPAADGERLLRVEVADLTEIEVGTFLEGDGAAVAAFLEPRRGGAVGLGLRWDAGPFVERETTEQPLGRDVLVEVRGFEFGEPTIEVLAGRVAEVARLFLGGFDLGRERVPSRTVGVGREVDHRTATILHVAVEAGLGRVAEEGGQRVEVLRREWVELVVMALRAVGGQAQVDPADRLHAVGGIVGEVLLDDGAAFIGRGVAPLQTGGDQLRLRRIGQEVAGQLLDRERVERLVRVEGFDDPIAVGPHLAGVVEVQAVGVGVAGRVEPIAGAVLAVSGRRHQFVHQGADLRILQVGGVLGQVLGEEFRRRRQAGDIEGEAADERAGVGLGGGGEPGGLELGEDEGVDGVLGPARLVGGRRGCDGREEGPVRLPRGALFNPRFDLRHLRGLQCLVRLGRRHDLVFVLGDDALEERALVGLALDDGRGFFLAVLVLARGEEAGLGVETQAGFARAGVGAVAMEAGVGEHRADVAVELHGVRGESRRGEKGEQGKGRSKHGRGAVSISRCMRKDRKDQPLVPLVG